MALKFRKHVGRTGSPGPGKGFRVTLKPGDHAAQARRLAGCLARYAKGRGSTQSDDSAILGALAGDDARIRAYAKRKPR